MSAVKYAGLFYSSGFHWAAFPVQALCCENPAVAEIRKVTKTKGAFTSDVSLFK